MKKDKELISEIVDRLKTIEELPYKEGAWEVFRDKSVSTNPKLSLVRRYAAVAAMLLIGILISYYTFIMKDGLQNELIKNEENIVHILPKIIDGTGKIDTKTLERKASNYSSMQVKSSSIVNQSQHVFLSTSAPDSLRYSNQYADFKNSIPALFYIEGDLKLKNDFEMVKPSSNLLAHFVKANAQLSHKALATTLDVEKSISPRIFKIADRFDLGLFVSPHSSAENWRIGAGFTLSYNLNSKLSIRTGASYNTYEVGILKNPLEIGSVERVETQVVNSALYGSHSGQFSQVSTLALPNINAVTGFVKSVEIPLELKYNMNKSFYAVAGVSYSNIVSQERNAQYIENVNYDTFRNGFPENEMEASQALEVVTKTVRSAEKNVNTSGYSGFVNLSIGKKVNMNKKFTVSIEPYYKIPVGEFRKADMNYSNGGIRIMTNF